MQFEFACPACRGDLEKHETFLFCPLCNKKYDLHQNVPCFGETTHYGEIEESLMNGLLTDCKQNDWRDVIHQLFFRKNRFLYEIITNETRADFMYLLPIGKTKTVLDAGCGWGTISIPLAKNCNTVVALDGTLNRLMFVKERAEQEKLDNVVPVCADLLNAPFKKEQFDIIVLNGVLEWIGELCEGNPEELQKNALKTAFEICKPGGYIYIGIENQYGMKYLLGAKDDHSGIINVTFLDRIAANAVSNAIKNKEYRTYTYNFEKYKKMITESGFSEVAFYCTIPDYKQPMHITPLFEEKNRVLAYYFENVGTPVGTVKDSSIGNYLENECVFLEKLAVEKNKIHVFSNSYGIVARRPEA